MRRAANVALSDIGFDDFPAVRGAKLLIVFLDRTIQKRLSPFKKQDGVVLSKSTYTSKSAQVQVLTSSLLVT
jgi:hypothetical protein